jgi:hypothetical protein
VGFVVAVTPTKDISQHRCQPRSDRFRSAWGRPQRRSPRFLDSVVTVSRSGKSQGKRLKPPHLRQEIVDISPAFVHAYGIRESVVVFGKFFSISPAQSI